MQLMMGPPTNNMGQQQMGGFLVPYVPSQEQRMAGPQQASGNNMSQSFNGQVVSFNGMPMPGQGMGFQTGPPPNGGAAGPPSKPGV
jgi:hypothetical protein